MDTQPTPEDIIASALNLPPEQRMAVVNALLETVPAKDLDSANLLNQLLASRVMSARQGNLSDKTFSDIKREARLEN